MAKRRKKWDIRKIVVFSTLSAVVVLTALFLFLGNFVFHTGDVQSAAKNSARTLEKPDITEDFLTPNTYSRPQTPLEKIKGVVIHYTANPGSTAKENRDYFDGLKKQTSEDGTKASSHFIVGIKGEIIQCIPLEEIAYCSNERNEDTVSIECCHKDETGEFSDATYQSVVWLTAWLCKTYGIKKKNVIRHYDVTGKDCPRYFVKHPDAWKQLKKDVFALLD